MKKPLVSVVVAAFNAEPWLAETLDSVLAQTWKNIEIIVVDDGSQDETLAVAKQYESPQVIVIHQKNQGQCAASNHCLKVAQGDFIQYLDADDLLAPDKIEHQLNLLKRQPAGYITSASWARFYRSPEEATFKEQALWADFSPVDWLLCAWENHLMMHGAAWLLPRDIVEKAGPWDTRLSLINDFDYFSRVILASQGIVFCKAARTYYRSGLDSSLSGQKKTLLRGNQPFCHWSKGTSHLLAAEDSHRVKTSLCQCLSAVYL